MIGSCRAHAGRGGDDLGGSSGEQERARSHPPARSNPRPEFNPPHPHRPATRAKLGGTTCDGIPVSCSSWSHATTVRGTARPIAPGARGVNRLVERGREPETPLPAQPGTRPHLPAWEASTTAEAAKVETRILVRVGSVGGERGEVKECMGGREGGGEEEGGTGGWSLLEAELGARGARRGRRSSEPARRRARGRRSPRRPAWRCQGGGGQPPPRGGAARMT